MFADELKRIRQEKKWTQKELAEKIHKSVSVISSWERGIRMPNAQSILALSKILDIHIENDTIAFKKKTAKKQTKTKAITTKQTKTSTTLKLKKMPV